MRQTKISVKHLQAAARLYRVSRHYMQEKIRNEPQYVDPLLDEVLDAVVEYEYAIDQTWGEMEDFAIHEGFASGIDCKHFRHQYKRKNIRGRKND